MTETATAETLPFIVSSDAFAEHQKDMARRAKELEKTQELRYRCLDSRFAMESELKKLHYKYTVEVEWWTQSRESKEKKKHLGPMEIDDDLLTGGRLVVRKEKRKVVAQNEVDAWALFCDAIQEWPSPNLPGMKKKFTRSKEPVDSELVLSLIQDTRM